MVHLSLLIGQLTSAITRSLVDHSWRHNLCIASLTGLVEEEVDERPLQAGSLTDIYRESCTCDLHAQIEVDKIIFLGKIPVGQRASPNPSHRGEKGLPNFVKFSNGHRQLPTFGGGGGGFHYAVILCCLSFRHFVVRDIGNLAEQTGHLVLSIRHLIFQLFVRFLEFGYRFLDGVGLVFLAFFHHSTNLGCHLFGFRKVFI